MITDLLIYGAGETGIMIAEDIRISMPAFRVAGFIDDHKTSHDYYAPIIGTSADLPRIKAERGLNNIAMGFPLPTRRRLDIARKLMDSGFVIPAIISDTSRNTYGVTVGHGTMVHNQSKICPGVTLGNFVMVNCFSCIEKSIIGDGVLVSPNCFIGWGVSIGEATTIYPNASVRPEVKIGKDCVIGMGVVVHRDLEDNTVYLGREKRQS